MQCFNKKLKFSFSARLQSTCLLMQFDLICSKTYWYTVAETLFKSGILVGALLFGSLSDRLGRRPVFFYALCQQLTCGVIAAFAPNYTVFVVARFLIGVSNSGVFLVAFVIGELELLFRSLNSCTLCLSILLQHHSYGASWPLEARGGGHGHAVLFHSRLVISWSPGLSDQGMEAPPTRPLTFPRDTVSLVLLVPS